MGRPRREIRKNRGERGGYSAEKRKPLNHIIWFTFRLNTLHIVSLTRLDRRIPISTNESELVGLTDEEILKIGMHYGVPQEGFDLMSPEDVPCEPVWIKLVAKYKCKDAVKCMRPSCGQPHNEGAVVEIKISDKDTGLINIGHDCGQQLFPDEYHLFGTRYDADLERKQLIKRKRVVLSREDQIIKWFDRVQEPFQKYDQARNEFEAFFPDLLSEINIAFWSGYGELKVVQSGTAFKEAMSAEGIKGHSDAGYVVIHRVMGKHFFSQGSLIRRTENAKNKCQEYLERLRPDNLPVSEMTECLDGLRTFGEKMERMVKQYQDMFLALSVDNLRGLAEWSRKVKHDSPFEFRRGGLFRHPDGRLPSHFLKAKSGIELVIIDNFPIKRAA